MATIRLGGEEEEETLTKTLSVVMLRSASQPRSRTKIPGAPFDESSSSVAGQLKKTFEEIVPEGRALFGQTTAIAPLSSRF